MPEYQITIRLQQIPYLLRFNAENVDGCRRSIMRFFRALGIARNVQADIDATVANVVVYEHIRNYTMQIPVLPPVEAQAVPAPANDLGMIRQRMNAVFGRRDDGHTAVTILRDLDTIRMNHQTALRDAEIIRTRLAATHRAEILGWSTQEATLRTEKRNTEAQLHTCELERNESRDTVTELRLTNTRHTTQLTARDTEITVLQGEVEQLRNQVTALTNALNECRNNNPAIN